MVLKKPANVSRFQSFEAYYPSHLEQHSKVWTKRFHFMGINAAIMALGVYGKWWLAPVAVVGCSLISHKFIEKNQPQTLSYPWYNIRGDMRMWYEMMQGEHWFEDTPNMANRNKEGATNTAWPSAGE